MVKSVGHADGDLDAVVECLEARVGVAQPDRPEDVGPASPDLPGEPDDFGDAAVRGPEHPVVQLAPGLFDRVLEQGPQQFLELPGAVELGLGVRVPDAVERVVLLAGQVVRVLQDRVLGAAHALRGLLVAVVPRLVPQAFADLVERAGHPADDVEAVQYALGVRAPPADARVDPAGPVAGDGLDGGALFGRQRLEEQVEHVPADPVVRPDDPVPLVVDDHGQVRVALAVAGLVHPDRVQAVERRGHRRLQPSGDPAGDVSGGPPRHVQETADRLLVRDAHQPRALRLEIPGGPAARLRPRHHRHDHAALGAVDARHHGDRLDPEAAGILMTPAAHAAALVVTMTTFAAAGASEHALARAHADFEHGHGAQRRVDDPHVLDHRVFDVEELFEHAVHQALCGCLFILAENILPGKRSSSTPTTAQRRTHTHKNNRSAEVVGVAHTDVTRFLFRISSHLIGDAEQKPGHIRAIPSTQ